MGFFKCLFYPPACLCVCVCVCFTPEPEIKKEEKIPKAGKCTF